MWFNPVSRAIVKERLRWLRHVLQMKYDRLSKIVLFGQPSRAKGRRFKGNGNFLEGCKKGGFEQIELEEERVQLCWLRAAWCCGELFVALVYTKILILFFPKKIKNVCLFIIIFCLFISRNMTVSNQ